MPTNIETITFTHIFYFIITYLVGAIPFAYILVKLIKKVDIRTVGSGNAGATNAGRILGKKGFIAVFILDFLKGFLPVYIAKYVLNFSEVIVLLVAFLAIFGHIYTVFLNFKGGKGVATGIGVYVGLSPISALIAFGVFIITFLIGRMVSLGSILGALALFISVLIIEDSLFLKVLTALIAGFVIYKHKSNIKRIIDGTESKFNFSKKKDNKVEDNQSEDNSNTSIADNNGTVSNNSEEATSKEENLNKDNQ